MSSSRLDSPGVLDFWSLPRKSMKAPPMDVPQCRPNPPAWTPAPPSAGGGRRCFSDPTIPFDNERWDYVTFKNRGPKLIPAVAGSADAYIELDAKPRNVMSPAGNLIVGGPATFAAGAAAATRGYVPYGTGASTIPTSATAHYANGPGAILEPYCCYAAGALHAPVTCDETLFTDVRYFNHTVGSSRFCTDSPTSFSIPGGTVHAYQTSYQDCPMFGDPAKIIPDSGGKPEAVFANNVTPLGISPSLATQTPRISCKYDMNAIAQSCSATADWSKMLSDLSGGTTIYDTALMESMCKRTFVGKDGKETVNYLECPKCQEWAEMLEYKDTDGTAGRCSTNPFGGSCPAMRANTAMTEWCNDHPTNPRCKCVRRADQADYQKWVGVDRSNDGCWYRPCAGGMTSASYLVPYSERHAKETSQCPDICQSIIDFGTAHDISTKDISQTTVCAGGGGGDDGNGGSFFTKYKYWLIGGGSVATLLLLLLPLLFFVK